MKPLESEPAPEKPNELDAEMAPPMKEGHSTSAALAMTQATIKKLPIGIEEAYKIPWSELKKLLIKKYCSRTEIKKMEDEFYNLTVKGNDLKNYIIRFQELAVLCPNIGTISDKTKEGLLGVTEVLKEMLPLQSLKL
ncbi:reverse transcriptase domain-containing protein [Tanacetum coccineum]